jgi:hypothetical protein
MTPFEYVSVLISIILGLGITLVLTGVAELIKRWKTINHFWPYLIWIILVFVLHLQEWWICYELKSVTSWSLPSFLFVISYPILLFILANLLFPTDWSKEGIDLKEFYFRSNTKFFVCTILLISISIVQNIVLSGYKIEDQVIQFVLLLIFSGLLIKPTRNTAVHTIIALLMLTVMIVTLFFTSDTLVISQ